MAEINIPTGPIGVEPYNAIVRVEGETTFDANAAALAQVLEGVELAEFDKRIVGWLSGWKPSAVATVCSWIARASALRAQAAPPTPAAATPSAVLRRALDLLDGRDVVAAIRAASGNEQLADKAFLELAEFVGYGLADPAGAVALWQDAMPEHEIRRILPRAADHAEGEGR